MPITNLSLGRDIKLSFLDPITLQPLSFNNEFVSFEVMPTPIDRKKILMNGQIIYPVIPEGYTINVTMERLDNGAFERFWCAYEAAYYNNVNIQNSTATMTIANPDGSLSEYLFTNVGYKPDSFGEYSGDDFPKMKLTIYAGRMQVRNI